MSLTLAMETAIKSLRTHTYALNTVNHNIANMNTTGYTRQLATITAAEAISLYGTAGQIGTGSRVSYMERIRDTYLDKMIRTELSNVGEWTAMKDAYDTIKAAFPEVDGITAGSMQEQIDAFWKSWQDVAAAVKSGGDVNGAKTKVVSAASMLATLFNSKAQTLSDIQVAITNDLKIAVDDANLLLEQVFDLNKQIVMVQGMGEQPNDLLDKRDVALAGLAKLLNIATVTKADGSVVVNLNGHILVNGADGYNNLTTVAGLKDGKLEGLALFEYTGQRPVRLSNNIVTGGRIAGLIEARDKTVEYYKIQVDSLASSVITVVNSIHSTALAGGAYRDLFTGDDASSMAINQAIFTTPGNLADSKYGTGDIAEILGNLGNKLVSTWVTSPTTALTSTSTLNASGTLRINGVDIPFTAAQTIADLINNINSHLENFSATYDDINHKFFMVMSEPLTIEELNTTGTAAIPPPLLNRLRLVEEQVSASAVSYFDYTVFDKIKTNQTWMNQNPKLDWEVAAQGSLIVTFGGQNYEVKWTDDEPIITTVGKTMLFNFPATTPALQTAYFDPKTQKFHFGTGVNSGAGANIIAPFMLSDEQGEMTQTMKMMGNMTFDDFYESITAKLETNVQLSDDMLTSYQNALDQFQGIQDNITKVDEKEELARAKLYQRAYDASVRLMSVVDEMLNMLINRTATPSSSSD